MEPIAGMTTVEDKPIVLRFCVADVRSMVQFEEWYRTNCRSIHQALSDAVRERVESRTLEDLIVVTIGMEHAFRGPAGSTTQYKGNPPTS